MSKSEKYEQRLNKIEDQAKQSAKQATSLRERAKSGKPISDKPISKNDIDLKISKTKRETALNRGLNAVGSFVQKLDPRGSSANKKQTVKSPVKTPSGTNEPKPFYNLDEMQKVTEALQKYSGIKNEELEKEKKIIYDVAEKTSTTFLNTCMYVSIIITVLGEAAFILYYSNQYINMANMLEYNTQLQNSCGNNVMEKNTARNRLYQYENTNYTIPKSTQMMISITTIIAPIVAFYLYRRVYSANIVPIFVIVLLLVCTNIVILSYTINTLFLTKSDIDKEYEKHLGNVAKLMHYLNQNVNAKDATKEDQYITFRTILDKRIAHEDNLATANEINRVSNTGSNVVQYIQFANQSTQSITPEKQMVMGVIDSWINASNQSSNVTDYDPTSTTSTKYLSPLNLDNDQKYYLYTAIQNTSSDSNTFDKNAVTSYLQTSIASTGQQSDSQYLFKLVNLYPETPAPPTDPKIPKDPTREEVKQSLVYLSDLSKGDHTKRIKDNIQLATYTIYFIWIIVLYIFMHSIQKYLPDQTFAIVFMFLVGAVLYMYTVNFMYFV